MKRHTRFWSLILPTCLFASTMALIAACGAGGADEAGGFGASDNNGPVTPDAGTDALPPEEEVEASYGAPVATGTYVWVANPASGRIAYIDATTLEVRVVEAGNAPTFLAAVPDAVDDVAIVLNVLSFDATILRDHGGNLTATSVATPSSGNGWAISSKGRWAVAWTDARRVENADPIDGYQDITVIDLSEGAETSTPLTVGYRPVAVAFDEAEGRAFAVTQDGVSVIALDGSAPKVLSNVKLSDDPIDDTSTRDVSITPDGAFALVRRDGLAEISIFSLATGERADVALSAPATDMDLSADGSVAVVVMRETGEVALLPIPEIAADPATFVSFVVDSAVIGSASLASESSIAFLYTNAVESPLLTVFDAAHDTPNPITLLLRAPVKAVFPTPDAAHAVVLHDAFELSGGSKYPAALSIVPIAADLPSKILGLDAPVISVAISPSGDRALVATGDATGPRFEMVVAHMPSLQIDRIPLASRPISAGIVAGANRGFVAQEHPDGRITFVDFNTGDVRTLTGFELASQVVTGSK